MSKPTKEQLEVRKNIFDLAKELAILVDEMDQKKLVNKTNL